MNTKALHLATKILLLAQEISHPTPGRLPTEGRPEAGASVPGPTTLAVSCQSNPRRFSPMGQRDRPSPKPLKPKVCCIQVRFSSLALRLVDLRPAWLVNRRTAD